MTRALAWQNLNLRGFSGAAIGKHAVLYIAVDTGDDVKLALRALTSVK